MGTSHSFAEVGAKLERLAGAVERLPKHGTEASALALKKALVTAAPPRLRGVGKRGAKLGVRYTLSGVGAEQQALVFALGPWQLIEGDTKPHQIPKERKRGRRRYAVIGDDVYSRVQHPGTQGKHIWRKTTEAYKPLFGKPYALGLATELHRIF